MGTLHEGHWLAFFNHISMQDEQKTWWLPQMTGCLTCNSLTVCLLRHTRLRAVEQFQDYVVADVWACTNTSGFFSRLLFHGGNTPRSCRCKKCSRYLSEAYLTRYRQSQTKCWSLKVVSHDFKRERDTRFVEGGSNEPTGSTETRAKYDAEIQIGLRKVWRAKSLCYAKQSHRHPIILRNKN